VTAAPSNVKALHPMRVLLVTDDDRFADRITSAAEQQGLPIARASTQDDLETTADETSSNVVALDARTRLGRTARTATTFATLHPSIAVVVVARRASPRTLAGLTLVEEWSPPERLLDELNAAHLGLTR
jgi:DNA-binding response OmpR family regulator